MSEKPEDATTLVCIFVGMVLWPVTTLVLERPFLRPETLIEIDYAPLYYIWMLAVLGIIGLYAGVTTGLLLSDCKVEYPKRDGWICVFLGGLLVAALGYAWFIFLNNMQFDVSTESKQRMRDLIRCIIWTGAPFLWASWLFYQGIRLLRNP